MTDEQLYDVDFFQDDYKNSKFWISKPGQTCIYNAWDHNCELYRINSIKGLSYYVYRKFRKDYYLALTASNQLCIRFLQDDKVIKDHSRILPGNIVNMDFNDKYLLVLFNEICNCEPHAKLYIYAISPDFELEELLCEKVDHTLIEDRRTKSKFNYPSAYPLISITKRKCNAGHDNIIAFASSRIGWVTCYGWDDNYKSEQEEDKGLSQLALDFKYRHRVYFEASSTPISYLTISPMGEYLITVDRTGNKIKLWDILNEYAIQQYDSSNCNTFDWKDYHNR